MRLKIRPQNWLQLVLLGGCLSGANIGTMRIHAEAPAPPVVQEAISPSDGVIKLFDGKTLGDCYTYLQDSKREDPRKVFRITDGMLHITGDGYGGLLTNKAYRDYHLVLEFKWGDRTWQNRKEAARDSGLLIHCNGADGGYGGIWMPGIEVQIIEGGVGDFLIVPGKGVEGEDRPVSISVNAARDRDDEVIWKADAPRMAISGMSASRVNWFGRDVDWEDKIGFRGAHDLESPLGKWTRIDVIADGGHVQTFVNGKLANEAFDVSPSAGRLELQSELAEIFFRRWELWPVGKGPEPAPAKQ